MQGALLSVKLHSCDREEAGSMPRDASWIGNAVPWGIRAGKHADVPSLNLLGGPS
jgi:hypothetical protein